METHEVLTKAADLIEQRGHNTNGLYISKTGCLCVMGAVHVVLGGEIKAYESGGLFIQDTRIDWTAVDDTREDFYDFLTNNADKYHFGDRDSVTSWNDRSDRDTVVRAMRDAANKWKKSE